MFLQGSLLSIVQMICHLHSNNRIRGLVETTTWIANCIELASYTVNTKYQMSASVGISAVKDATRCHDGQR